MKEKTRKNSINTLLGAFALIALCALLFNSITEGVAAAELNKAEKVQTSYTTSQTTAKKSAAPVGYQKANYTVVADPLEYYADKKPAQTDLTQEKAAELGAQMLWEVFGKDLSGATIYMGYDPGTEMFPRAFWNGDVRFSKARTPETPGYSFMLDAATGEPFSVVWARILDVDVPLEFDMALEKNPNEYLKLGKEWADKLNMVHGEVKSVEYVGQGYGANDPSISVNVIGVNGETALLSFSRYDKKLTGIGYPAENKISSEASEKWEKSEKGETETMAAIETGKADSKNTTPTLIPLP